VSAYHYVKPGAAGRWLVVHDVPGTTTASIDADCLTLSAAERECAWLNAERDMGQRGVAVQRAQPGRREESAGAPRLI
jgi:hypothetical protein